MRDAKSERMKNILKNSNGSIENSTQMEDMGE